MNRETWLQKAVEALRPLFSAKGLEFPTIVHVSVGFPSKGALSRKVQRLGECWHHKISADSNPHIYINPTVADGIRALDILVHELIHAALPEAGHKAQFAKAAKQLGLEGKPKNTHAGDSLRADLQELVDRIGVYPHAALSPTLIEEKKQTTRMLKVVCLSPQCEVDGEGRYTARMAQKWLTKFGPPLCPNCEAIMQAEKKSAEDTPEGD